MIRVSFTRKDSVFVSHELRTLRLDPVPASEYYDEPDYFYERDGWGRVVERYAWGAVLYLDSPTSSATLVAVGAFDSRAGTVDGESLPVRWYRELAERCEMATMETPECAGYWIAGVTCDGGTNSAGEPEHACTWRRRCRLVQDHLVQQDTDPKAYTARYGDGALTRLVGRLEKSPGAKRVKQKQKAKRKPKPKKDKKQAKRKPSPSERRAKRYSNVRALVPEFLEHLASAVDGRRVRWVEKRTAAVKPGCVYVVDRTAKGVCLNIYMRIPKGRPHKLAVLRLAPINGGLDVQVPDSAEPVGMVEGLRWAPWKEPPMWSVIRTLNTPEHYRWLAGKLAADAAGTMEDFS